MHLLKRGSRRWAVVGFLVLMLLVGAGIEASAKQVTIEFWNGHTGPDGKVMAQLVGEFEKTHPDIRINVTTLAWDELFTKTQLALTNHSGPDLVTMPVDRLAEYKDKLFKPISDLIDQFGLDTTSFDANLWNLANLGGKQYGIPLDTHPYVIYYRADLFKEAGIPPLPKDRPLTRDEFLKIAKALTTSEHYGFAFKQTSVHAWWDTWPFFLQAGGQLYNADKSRVLLNSQAGIEAVNFLKELREKYKVTPPDTMSWQSAFSLFQQGKVAMLMHGSWLIPALQSSKVPFETAMVPQLFDKTYASFANMHMFALTRLNRERAEAAMEFVKWIEEPQNAVKWGLGSGNVPANLKARAIYEKEPLFTPMAKTAGMLNGRLFMAPYRDKLSTLIYKVIVPGLEAIYRGDVPVKQGLDNIVEEANGVLR